MNIEKIESLSNRLFSSPEGFQLMVKLKTDIQNTLVNVMDNSQKNNLRSGIRDEKTIKDILDIAKRELNKLEYSEKNIFAVSMSSSVILKELDFTDYNSLEGILKIYDSISN